MLKEKTFTEDAENSNESLEKDQTLYNPNKQ